MASDLSRKLGLRAGMRVCLLAAPAESGKALREAAPGGVRWTTRLAGAPFDLIFFWPRDLAGLTEAFDRLQRHLLPNGALWAVMPKKAHAAAQGVGFSWEQMQRAGLRGDLVDNKVASITDTDYGTRFVIRKERRGRHAWRRRQAP